MHDSQAQRVTHPLRSALVISIMAVLGAFAAYYWLVHFEVAPQHEYTSSCAPVDKSRFDNSTSQRIEPRESTSTSESIREPNENGQSSNTSHDDRVSISVVCRTPEGDPVPSVTLRCVIQAKPETVGTGKWYVEDKHRVTNSAGSIHLTSLRSHLLAIELATDGWYAPVTRSDFSETRVLTIELRPTASVRIRIQYSDGYPYVGRGLLVGIDDPYANYFDCDSNGTSIVEDVPVDRALNCRPCSALKPGYAGPNDSQPTKLEVHELTSGRELLVVLPPATNPDGMIRINFLNGYLIRGKYTLQSKQSRVAEGSFATNQDGAWISGTLQPGKYRATFSGNQAWQSDWIEVGPGEETVIEATFQVSGSARARLLDGEGKPVIRGQLRLADGSYISWNKAVPQRGRQMDGWSDEEGIVVLGGLPPGTLTIEAESKGREPVALQAAIVSGETSDLGDIVLVEATGEITVELTGQNEGVEYAIVVFAPSEGPPILPFQVIHGSSGTVKGLPLRTYDVCVTGKRGGSLVTATVALSRDQPSQSVSLNVASVKPD